MNKKEGKMVSWYIHRGSESVERESRLRQLPSIQALRFIIIRTIAICLNTPAIVRRVDPHSRIGIMRSHRYSFAAYIAIIPLVQLNNTPLRQAGQMSADCVLICLCDCGFVLDLPRCRRFYELLFSWISACI